MPFGFVAPEVYHRYKDEILSMSQAIQVNYPEHLPPDKRKPGFSDRQIAEKLGIDAETVREIRCVAERQYYDIDEWFKAIEFKEKACREYRRQGLSSVTKKYLKK
ncbi:MAG: hypothetical protein WD076_02595 [Parvularculaceae bacterium]